MTIANAGFQILQYIDYQPIPQSATHNPKSFNV
ncbi:MAG: hypothetical protein RIS64_1675 [Bacteroidota bacterium]|jgi:hypothetical protein